MANRTANVVMMLLGCILVARSVAAIAEGNRVTPPALTDSFACRAITDDQRRLACYDRSVDALKAADASGDLVVVSKAEIQNTKHSLFGLNLPTLNLLGKGGAGTEDEQITGKVLSATFDAGDRLVLVLEDHATWVQTDDTTLPRAPTAGEMVTLKRGALGSYFIAAGRSYFRAKRINTAG